MITNSENIANFALTDNTSCGIYTKMTTANDAIPRMVMRTTNNVSMFVLFCDCDAKLGILYDTAKCFNTFFVVKKGGPSCNESPIKNVPSVAAED